MEKQKQAKTSGRFATIFSVAAVLFSWHAGGGFATGNQANQYFIVSGRMGLVSALLALLLLTLTVRQAIVMYNSRRLGSYKELLETLYHPLDKLELVFEIYYYIMVLMCVSSCIAGAATLLSDALGVAYGLGIVLIGALLLVLSMFGAGALRKVSSALSLLILLCAVTIFIVGIGRRADVISSVLHTPAEAGTLPGAVFRSFQYAGFQCSSIPTMIACGTVLSNEKEAGKSMWLSFAMNALALVLSVTMLLGWQEIYQTIPGGSTIPTLTVCKQMGITPLVWAYYICLFLCFVSNGVCSVFGVVNRFEKSAWLTKTVPGAAARRAGIAFVIMAAAVCISVVGLSNIIKYGYGYCGYIGIVMLVIPFLTVGVYKNRKYLKEHHIPES